MLIYFPVIIKIPILAEWTSLDALREFDTSLCCVDRSAFLTLITADIFIHNGSHKTRFVPKEAYILKILKWLLLRNVKIRKFHLKCFPMTAIDIFLMLDMHILCRKVEGFELELKYESTIHGFPVKFSYILLKSFLDCMPNLKYFCLHNADILNGPSQLLGTQQMYCNLELLTEITFHDCDMKEQVFLQLFKNTINLTKISINDGCGMKYLCNVVHYFPELLQLDITLWKISVEQNNIANIVSCKFLRQISLSWSSNMYSRYDDVVDPSNGDAILQCITDNCEYLTDLNISASFQNISDNGLIYVITKLSNQLMRLNIDNADRCFTNKSLEAIATYGKMLQYINVSGMRTTAHYLLLIISKCQQLSHFEATRCLDSPEAQMPGQAIYDINTSLTALDISHNGSCTSIIVEQFLDIVPNLRELNTNAYDAGMFYYSTLQLILQKCTT